MDDASGAMTPRQVWDACRALEREVGPGARVSMYINDACHTGCWAALRPSPTGTMHLFTMRGGSDTWSGALDDLRAQWAEKADRVDEEAVRNLALAIVRVTYDQGSCTDAALRAEFDAETVERYGARAVERANAMAEGAPFSIVETGPGNGPAGGDAVAEEVWDF